MQVRFLKEDLLYGVSVTQRAVPSKAPLPILAGLLIKTVGENQVEITANDMEFSIQCTVSAQISEQGAVVLPARFLGEIVRRLPDGAIDLSVNASHQATLTGERLELEINGMDPLDFPASPLVDQQEAWTVEQGIFRKAIQQVAFAISTDESRPAMTGALLRLHPDGCALVTLDGFRFAERRIATPAPQAKECVIPGKALTDLVKLIADDDSPLRILIGSNHVTFAFDRVIFSSRLIEAQFPFKSATDLIRREPTTTVRSSVKRLNEGIDRALLVTRDSATNSNIVKMQFSLASLNISSNSPDIGRLHEEMTVELDGEELLIGFNGRYLNDILKAMDTEEMECRFSGPLAAATFRPVGHTDFISILSPIRI